MNPARILRRILWGFLFGVTTATHAGGSLYICNNQQVKYSGPGAIALNYDGGGILGTRSKAQVDAIVDASIRTKQLQKGVSINSYKVMQIKKEAKL